ncbi:MAG: SPOR domain-containing protein [Cellulomonadaceae bacterium]
MSESPQYYFNVTTGQVELGKESPWDQRMGPYPTREAAAQALGRAQARTEAWDEEDERRRQERDDA